MGGLPKAYPKRGRSDELNQLVEVLGLCIPEWLEVSRHFLFEHTI